jgi:hypothetical protein
MNLTSSWTFGPGELKMILRRHENIKLIAKTHLAIGKVSLHVKYEI